MVDFIGIERVQRARRAARRGALHRGARRARSRPTSGAGATFEKSPRHATHSAVGVIELMPTCDGRLYAFKYVNGHPKNTAWACSP